MTATKPWADARLDTPFRFYSPAAALRGCNAEPRFPESCLINHEPAVVAPTLRLWGLYREIRRKEPRIIFSQ
jgi:hypothetical protein